METNKIITLANKLRKSFIFQNSYDLLKELRNNKFIKDLTKDPADLLKLFFYIHLSNQGYSSEEISDLLNNHLFGIKVIEITNDEPTMDCDDCGANGHVGCDSCYGDGNIECRNCDGTGEESCPDCGGDGEIDGEVCDECQGGGSLSCTSCGGGGDEECSSCDGSGNHECVSCDADGYIMADGQQEYDIYYILSINKELENQLISEEYPLNISEDTFSKIKSDKLSVIISRNTDISDDFYGDFQVGDIFVEYIDESSPSLSWNYLKNYSRYK